MAVTGERGIVIPIPQNETGPILTDTLTQPKRQLGDYVESQGFLVPQRYDNLSKALRSGKPFIVRSEHPQDIKGASGLINSFVINDTIIQATQQRFGVPDSINWKLKTMGPGVVREQIIAQIRRVPQEEFESNLIKSESTILQQYAAITDQDFSEFSSQVSYSYWELIPGYNRAVIADSAIPGRYHLFTTDPQGVETGYQIIQNNQIIDMSPNVPLNSQTDVSSLLNLYESIRNLDQFDSNQCPIIEMQTDENGNHYFLQYLLTRPFDKASFVLDRDKKPGEIEATFVRGATPPEGIVVNATIYNVYYVGGAYLVARPREQAAIDIHSDILLQEASASNRDAQIFFANNRFDVASSIQNNHLRRTQMFKSGLTLGIADEQAETLLGTDGHEVAILPNEDIVLPEIELEIFSDGNNSYINRRN